MSDNDLKILQQLRALTASLENTDDRSLVEGVIEALIAERSPSGVAERVAAERPQRVRGRPGTGIGAWAGVIALYVFLGVSDKERALRKVAESLGLDKGQMRSMRILANRKLSHLNAIFPQEDFDRPKPQQEAIDGALSMVLSSPAAFEPWSRLMDVRLARVKQNQRI